MSVRRGSVFGLLGPNGAGKSTLLRLVMGFIGPTSGRCEVDGVDPVADPVGVRSRVAYLPGDARLPRHMRGKTCMRFFADIHPRGDLDASRTVADRLELDDRVRVGSMSTGMRQKLALSVVLGVRSELLILDEPTANLDPSVRMQVLDLVREARRGGRTVVFSSHVLSEIEETCDDVVFLKRGKLVRRLDMRSLAQRHRITGRGARPNEPQTEVADDVRIQPDPIRGADYWRVDHDGDLATILPWLGTLSLDDVRIEPVGLANVYRDVHFETPSDPSAAS